MKKGISYCKLFIILWGLYKEEITSSSTKLDKAQQSSTKLNKAQQSLTKLNKAQQSSTKLKNLTDSEEESIEEVR